MKKNNKSTLLTILISLTIGVISLQTQAQKGIYLGAGLGPSFINKNITDLTGEDLKINDNNLSYKFYAGWRLAKFIGIEGGFRNLGKVSKEISGMDIEAKTNGWDIEGVGFLPIGPFDIFGKAGAFFWNTEDKIDPDPTTYGKGTSFMFGLGAGFRLGRLGFRAEWEMLDVSKDSQLSMLTAGISFKFIEMGD